MTRELDAQVAEAMGYEVTGLYIKGWRDIPEPLPHYTTDIAVAWQVVAWIHQHNMSIWIITSPEGYAWVEIWELDIEKSKLPTEVPADLMIPETGGFILTQTPIDFSKTEKGGGSLTLLNLMKFLCGAYADTAPEAICRAFLKAMGVGSAQP